MGEVVSIHENDEDFDMYCDLIAHEKTCVEQARNWLADEDLQSYAQSICFVIEEFLALANYNVPEEDMLFVCMQLIETQVSEWTSHSKSEVIKVLAKKLGFEATLKESEV